MRLSRILPLAKLRCSSQPHRLKALPWSLLSKQYSKTHLTIDSNKHGQIQKDNCNKYTLLKTSNAKTDLSAVRVCQNKYQNDKYGIIKETKNAYIPHPLKFPQG